MSNCELATADRLTHVKNTMVSLIACVAVVCIGKTARPELNAKNARIEVHTQMMVADRPVLWTGADRIANR